jgi:hypothetical protein
MGWFEVLSRPMHQAFGDDKRDHIPSAFGQGQQTWCSLPIDREHRDSRRWTQWSRPRPTCQNCEKSRAAGKIGAPPSGGGR